MTNSMNYKSWFLELMLEKFVRARPTLALQLGIYRGQLTFEGKEREFIDYYDDKVRGKLSYCEWCSLVASGIKKEE